MPVRLTGAFLIGTAVFFAVMWLAVTASHLAAGTEVDRISQYVIAIDGVILLPLAFFGGLWLWRRQPLGFALAGLLLVKVVATSLTLVATTIAAMAQLPPDPIQTAAYSIGFVTASLLLIVCLRSVEPARPSNERITQRHVPRADARRV